MYLFGKNNNHLIKNNYKKTFSLPQKARLISKQISKCACGPDYIICLTKDNNVFCYFQSALYNIDFKSDEKIIDIATEDNLILFITQKGQLYASQFIPETVLNDSIKPKLIRLNLSFAGLREKVIKKVTIIKEHIFLKMQNNLIVYITKNDWMETKTFSDPQIVFASKNNNIMDIAFSQKTYIFLTEEGSLQITSPKDLSSNSIKIQMKESLKRIASNNVEILGINNEGSIVKIHFKNGKAKLQKMYKISVPFVGLVMNSQNCYAISQDNEAWGWGKNANGQLGLSDYEPRNSAYPLVTLEKFYITKICIGQNYACCLIDQTKQRQSVKISQRSSIGNSIFEVQRLFKKNQQNQSSYRDSFNQTEEFLMPIRYTDQESKVSSSNNDLNSSIEEKNIIVNKKQNYQKTNAFQKGNKSNRKQNNQGQKSSTRNERVSCKSNVSVSRSKCKSQVGVSQPKQTPKSINRSKSPFQKQKPKQTKNYPTKIYHSTCSDVMKSSTKSEKKSHAIVSYKTPNKQLEERQTLMLKQRQAEKQNQIRRLKTLLQQRQIQESESLKKITDAYKIEKQAYQREKQSYLIEKQSYQIEKQRLLQKIKDLEFHLRHKSDQNKDLFELITHKNLTIEDITSKIQLLQEAIQQHQRTLTARDNEAQEAFLRQKQYQLHINKLQTQIQKMMQVLNYNQRKSQTQIYKKEMERLSTQIKDRIQGQKEYYQDRIKSLQRKFQEEKNVYENEIRKLRDQVAYYKKKETEVLNRMKNQNADNAIRQPLTPYLQNNSQNFMESPSFHTLDIKKGVNNKAGEIQHPNQSIVTLNDECDQNEKFVLKESNRQDIYKSPFSKQSQEVKTRKNSRIYNQSEQYQNQNNFSRQKQQSQVKQILDRIQKNKTYISKSANKLLNILENDK